VPEERSDSASEPAFASRPAAVPRISLVVNTRNEEANLPGLLDSVAGVDELVVADMESTDRTLEIARSRGARILNLPNAGCCEPGRQPAIDHATGDWILVLDADERLPAGGLEKLRALVAGAGPDVGGFSFTFHVYVGETRVLSSGWDVGNEQHPRLFRRGRVTWPALVHYEPSVQGALVKVPEADLWIVHRNFLNLHHALEKFNRYSTVEARELLEAGRAPETMEGLRQALAELARRYSPREDGALSLALSFGIVLYRLLVQAKAAEMAGWPSDALPDRDALLRGVEALRRELEGSTIAASPGGRPAPAAGGPLRDWSVDPLESLPGGAPPTASAELLRSYLGRVLGTLGEQRTALAEGAREREELRTGLSSARADLASRTADLAQLRTTYEALEHERRELEHGLRDEEQRRRESELERQSLRSELDRTSLELERAGTSIQRLDREVEELRKSLAEATRFTWANLPGKIIGRARRYSPRKLLALRRAEVRELWRRRRTVRRIAASGLFDAAYYLEQNPDVAGAGWEPILHYVLHGTSEGRNPHPMFDTTYYLEQVPGLAASGSNPLLHFITRGMKEGLRPHPAYRADDLLGDRARRSTRSAPETALLPVSAEEQEAPATTDVSPAPDSPPDRFVLRGLTIATGAPRTAPAPFSRTLVVSHVLPYPPRAGNEYRIHRMVRHLASRGHEVVLVVSPLAGTTLDGGAVERAAAEYADLVVVRRDGVVLHACRSPEVLAAVESIGTERPQTFATGPTPGAERLETLERSFCPDHLISVLTRIDSRLQPDVVLCNYIFMGRFLPLLRSDALKVIDTHDVFSTKKAKVVQFGIADQLAVTGPEEAALLARADLVIAIQPEEQQELQAIVPGKRVVTAGVDFDRPGNLSLPPAEPVALVVASDNALNVGGARDLLSLGWPLIRQRCPDARLLVAGKVCDALEGTTDGVELLGPVDDLDTLYARARVVLNPAVAGTGLKIKTLEALAHLRPVVVWPSGTDGVSPALRRFCRVASSWYEFAEGVAESLSGRAASLLLERKEEIWSELSPEVVYAELERAFPGEHDVELGRTAQPG